VQRCSSVDYTSEVIPLAFTGRSQLMEADYEGKTSRRHFKVFLEMAPNLLSRVSTSVQEFHGVA
jgi:hypothetical protein